MFFSGININGHSGCTVNVFAKERQLYLSKSTNDPAYIPRLIAQAKKQNEFVFPASGFIKAPEIVSITGNNSECTILMKFIHSVNFVEFFENSGSEKIDRFADSMMSFIEWEISRSAIKEIPAAIMIDKFLEVRKKILRNKLLKNDSETGEILIESERLFQTQNSFELPIGVCHGDLTLSNILLNNDQIYLVDFLDSFLESPIMDMVKIRQDTTFGWSFLMYNQPYDKIRHRITLDYLDQVFQSHFKRYSWYKANYKAFQLMNFLRILQYAREDGTMVFLKTNIKEILKGNGI
jgi:serine/threonine protein kinase